MIRITLCVGLLGVLVTPAAAQPPELKFIADTLVVEAEGTYETEPDLATLTFDISWRDKELKRAYANASQSMRRITEVAEASGLKREDISTGVLRVSPSYKRNRKGQARSYTVHGRMILKVLDFSLIGSLLDHAVEEGVVDFRSLSYSLDDEESAKQRAVAEAMRHAVGRASSALAEKGQQVGALRYASLDVRQLAGVVHLEPEQLTMMEVASEFDGRRRMAGVAPPPPPVRPEKITVSATVQCAFEIQ